MAGRTKKEAGRDAILRAAVEVLLSVGLHAATTRAVTEQAGVGTGLLNHYFRWPELRAAAWTAIFSEVSEAQFPPGAEPQAAIEHYFATAFEPDARQYWQLWIEASDLAATDPAMAEALHAIQASLHDSLAAVLRAGNKTGRWQLRDADATALRLGALYDGLAALLISNTPRLDARKAEKHLRAAFALECGGKPRKT